MLNHVFNNLNRFDALQIFDLINFEAMSSRILVTNCYCWLWSMIGQQQQAEREGNLNAIHSNLLIPFPCYQIGSVSVEVQQRPL